MLTWDEVRSGSVFDNPLRPIGANEGKRSPFFFRSLELTPGGLEIEALDCKALD